MHWFSEAAAPMHSPGLSQYLRRWHPILTTISAPSARQQEPLPARCICAAPMLGGQSCPPYGLFRPTPPGRYQPIWPWQHAFGHAPAMTRAAIRELGRLTLSRYARDNDPSPTSLRCPRCSARYGRNRTCQLSRVTCALGNASCSPMGFRYIWR